jgi:Spy/CpxP family protein refolding chaperone
MKLHLLPPASLLLAGALCASGPLLAQEQDYQQQAPAAPPTSQAPAARNQTRMATPNEGNMSWDRVQQKLKYVSELLNLTPDQQARARQVFERAWTEAKPLLPELRQNREQMRTLFKNSNDTHFNAEIDRLAQRQGQVYGQMVEIHAKAMKEFYSMLNPQQKAKADALYELLTTPGPFERRMGARNHIPTE